MNHFCLVTNTSFLSSNEMMIHLQTFSSNDKNKKISEKGKNGERERLHWKKEKRIKIFREKYNILKFNL